MFANAAILAAVVQITNGFFFAGRPYEFSRPVRPEADILMSGKAVPDEGSGGYYYRPMDAVSNTLATGAAFDGRLKVYHKAFTDKKLRHEDLYWLAEVGGERYACWDTAIGPYRPVDWIDADLAARYEGYVSYTPDPLSVSGKYVRTPAYFSDYKSTSNLVEVLNAATNLYKKVPQEMFSAEYDTDDVESAGTILDFFYAEFGFGHVSDGVTICPRERSAFTPTPFTDAATSISIITNGSIFIPIERLSDVYCRNGEMQRVSTTEDKSSAMDTYWNHVSYDYEEFPANAYQKSVWHLLDPDHTNMYLNISTLTNSVRPGIVTNSVTHVSDITPQEPKSYRDVTVSYNSTETRWSLWCVSYRMSPFCALVSPDDGLGGGGETIVTTNREDNLEVVTDSGRRLDEIACSMLAYGPLVNGPSLSVRTICAVKKMSPDIDPGVLVPVTYFRTNHYTVSVSRATGPDGKVAIPKSGDFPGFLFYVLDIEFSYSLSYAGWSAWTSGGSHPYTSASGYNKRKLFPLIVFTGTPEEYEHRFAMSARLFASAKDMLLEYVYGKVPNANFKDQSVASTVPPYMPSSSAQPYVTDFPADMSTSLSFTIKNVFAASNLEFTQGTESPPTYHVPGYKHLDGLPPPVPSDGGDGWIGPFDMREGHGGAAALERFVQAYDDLVSSQTNAVPVSVIWDLYNYESVMVPDAYEFRGTLPNAHMDVIQK